MIEKKISMIELQMYNVLLKTPRLKKMPNKSLQQGNDWTIMSMID